MNALRSNNLVTLHVVIALSDLALSLTERRQPIGCPRGHYLCFGCGSPYGGLDGFGHILGGGILCPAPLFMKSDALTGCDVLPVLSPHHHLPCYLLSLPRASASLSRGACPLSSPTGPPLPHHPFCPPPSVPSPDQVLHCFTTHSALHLQSHLRGADSGQCDEGRRVAPLLRPQRSTRCSYGIYVHHWLGRWRWPCVFRLGCVAGREEGGVGTQSHESRAIPRKGRMPRSEREVGIKKVSRAS